MTCQCCGRRIFAETGTIAHHGYQRPGQGWQTASCMGAKELPFEVAREKLGYLITRLEQERADTRQHRAYTDDECEAVPFSYAEKRLPLGKRETVTIEVTRANIAEHAATVPVQVRYSLCDFDRLKQDRLRQLDREIALLDGEIEAQRKRFDGWKQTHERHGGGWRKLEAK